MLANIYSPFFSFKKRNVQYSIVIYKNRCLMNKMKGDTLLTAEKENLLHLRQANTPVNKIPRERKRKRKKEKRTENRAETLDRDFSVMS